MARDTRERSVRRDRPLNEDQRPVRLEQNRRFYTPRGNDSAVRNARALQNALGVGVEAYEAHLIRQNEKGERRAMNEAASGGERNEDDTNKGYNEAFDRVEAANDLALMASELPKMLEAEGWADLPEDQAQARIDEYYRMQLAGINPESVYGQIVAEGILKQNAQLLDVHRTFQAEKAQQERRIMVTNAARAAFEADDDLDHEQLMKDLHTLVPGPGGRMTYLEAVFDIAEEYGRPDLIDSIPERFPNGDPTGITDTNMDDLFDTARAKAQATADAMQTAREEQFKAEFQTERAALHSDLTQRAKAGDASVIQDIIAGGNDVLDADGNVSQPRLLSRAQQKTLFDQLFAAQEAAGISANQADLFGSGRAYGMTQTEYDNAAASFAQRVDTMFQQEHPEWTEEQREAEVLKVVLERSYRHDRLPKHITDFLTVTPASPERFAEAVNVKRMIDEYDPTLVQRSIPDRNAAMMDAYEFILRETGDQENAMEMIQQYDHTLSSGRGNEINEIVEDALVELADDMPGWGDYPITNRDRVRARRLAEHYVNLGWNDEKVEEFLVNGMRSRNTRVMGVMYPVDAGWRTGDEAAEWFMSSSPDNLWPEEADLVMEPHPEKRGYVIVRDQNAMLPTSGPEFRIADIESAYAENQDEQLQRMVSEAGTTADERLQAAEERAYNRMFPPTPWGEPGHRQTVQQMQRERWANLPAETRRRLIEAELTQP